MAVRRRACFAVIISALVGCGGGGGGSGGTPMMQPLVNVPGVPMISSATAGSGTVEIAFTAPSSNGGAAISSYAATCAASVGSQSNTGAQSPITVSNLTNDTAYDCTVTATNSAGASAASSSITVTPTAGEASNMDLELAGDWTLAPIDRAFGAGPNEGTYSFSASSAATVTERSCLFDDVFRFGTDGSFANVPGGQTWVEPWQGATAAGCATPVAPHDGRNSASYVFDSSASTITLNGIGAYLGLSKVVSDSDELSSPLDAPESIVYEVVASTANNMTLSVAYAEGYWTFALVRVAAAASAINKVIAHGGLDRSYIVYVPNTYDGTEAFPVLFNFHGFGGTADYFLAETNMRHTAHTNKFIVVYPQGSLLDGSPHWNPSVASADNKSDVDDLGFVEAMIAQLAVDYSVDTDRVYAVGYSNGGMMSYGLAAHKSNRIAAIGSVSGAMLDSGELPSHPMPVMKIHGTSDGTIPYTGGEYYNSVTSTLDYWVNFNNTNTNPIVSSTTDNGVTIERYQYTGGDAGVAVEHYKVIGGGHVWFDFSVAGQTSNDLIWDFFSQFDVNGKR